jgi:hypothetical protein
MVRVGYGDLLAAGLDVTGTNPLSLSLSNRGDPVAIDWFGDDDQSFESNESFVFYGQGFSGSVAENQYTDVNVYWLETAGWPALRMGGVLGIPSGAPPVDSYRATVRHEVDAKFTHLHTTELGEIDTWYMLKSAGAESITYPVTLTALASGQYSASVALEQFSDCRFTGSPELHRVQLRLNSVPIDTHTWQSSGGSDNCAIHLLSGPIDQSALTEGPGNSLTWVISTTHPYGEWLNWWEVIYQRRFEAIDDQLQFGLDSAGDWVYTVTGFSTGTLALWDISTPLEPVRILSPTVTGDGPYSATFERQSASPGRAVAAAEDSISGPLRISRYVPPELIPPNGADWIAITHQDFISEVARLADYRATQGIRTWVVELEDVFNQYGAGIYQPAAIRDYLAHAFSWSPPPPSYVVLVGDGNWNYKSVPDCYPYCDPDPVSFPPYMGIVDPYQGQVPTDNFYATVVFTDGIPDIALGRLPVRTITETGNMVDRIIQHESQLVDPVGWQFDLTFLADEYDPSAGDFHEQSEIVVNELPPYLIPNRIYHMQEPYTSTGATRDALVDAINEGTTIVNYRGHGSILVWGADGFFSAGYLPWLTNTDRLPVVFSFDCLDTYFAIPSLPSLAESIVRSSIGGSVAHWGSSGLGISNDHLILNRALFSAIFDDGLGRLGDAILAAKLEFAGQGWQQHNLHTFTLLGDPAMPVVASELRIGKQALGADYRHPGNQLSYVIQLHNRGLLWSTGTVLTDLVPPELTAPTIQWSGLQITPTAGVSYAWTVAPVYPYDGGVITLSGRIDSALAPTLPLTLSNTALVSTAGLDWDLENNSATALITLIPGADIYLPLLVRGP